MNTGNERHSSDVLFLMLFFACFLLMAVMLIRLGTEEYSRIVGRMQDNNDARITAAYVTQRVRQGLEEDGVEQTDFGGLSALRIRSRLGSTPCFTYLYVYEGQMMELIVPEAYASDVIPAAGTRLLPMQSLQFRQLREGTLLMEAVTGEGRPVSTILTITP